MAATDIMKIGWLGVMVFFVISGFVMVAGTNRDITGGDFFKRRLARIYPPLWVAFAAFYFAGNTLNYDNLGIGNTLRSITLIDIDPTYARHAMYVTWTLTFELLFYAAFALFIASGRRGGAWVILAAIAMIEALNATEDRWAGSIPLLLRDRQLYLFIIGCACGHLYLRSRLSHPAICCVGLALIVLGSAFSIIASKQALWFMTFPLGYAAFFGIGTALAILGSRSLAGHMTSRWWGWSGDISYAMYLTHPAIIALMQIIGLGWDGPAAAASPVIQLGLYVVIVIVISSLFQRFVERPLLAALQPRKRKPSLAPVAAPFQ